MVHLYCRRKCVCKNRSLFQASSGPARFSTRVIKREIVVQKCLNNFDIVSNFQSVVDSSEMHLDKQDAIDMLHAMIDLFIKIRIYSYTKTLFSYIKLSKMYRKPKVFAKKSNDRLKLETKGCEKVD